jgi:uncharacterized protein
MTNDVHRKEAPHHHFEVSLKDLDSGPIVLERDIPVAGLAERLQYCEYEAIPESGRVRLEIALVGDGVLVRGGIEACIQTQCGTCLADTVVNLTPEVNAYLMPKPTAAEEIECDELTPEDLEKEWYEGDKIVLDGLLYDSIMVEMPMNPKCGDSCRGLLTEAPMDDEKQIDPRLAPLAKIIAEKEK